jgi:hypothetical protein
VSQKQVEDETGLLSEIKNNAKTNLQLGENRINNE